MVNGPLVSIVINVFMRVIDRGLYLCNGASSGLYWLADNASCSMQIEDCSPQLVNIQPHGDTNLFHVMTHSRIEPCNLIGGHYQLQHRYYCRQAHNTITTFNWARCTMYILHTAHTAQCTLYIVDTTQQSNKKNIVVSYIQYIVYIVYMKQL